MDVGYLETRKLSDSVRRRSPGIPGGAAGSGAAPKTINHRVSVLSSFFSTWRSRRPSSGCRSSFRTQPIPSSSPGSPPIRGKKRCRCRRRAPGNSSTYPLAISSWLLGTWRSSGCIWVLSINGTVNRRKLSSFLDKVHSSRVSRWRKVDLGT
jgi:hypothetical protein